MPSACLVFVVGETRQTLQTRLSGMLNRHQMDTLLRPKSVESDYMKFRAGGITQLDIFYSRLLRIEETWQ